MVSELVRSESDAHGHAFWAYIKGKESYEIVERDDGYIAIGGLGPRTYFSEYKDWSEHEKKAVKFVRGRVLDIGCGAGRHSLYLQKKGFDVTGIDVSPLAIKICKMRGLKIAKLMSINQIDSFKPNSFDTIIMLGNNFGLFGSFRKAKLLLKQFHKITSPNGLIIAETLDPYQTDNPAHLQYHRLNRRRGRMAGQVRIRVRYQKYVGEWFDYLFVSRTEMKKILEGTGWRENKFISSGKPSYIAIIGKNNQIFALPLKR